MFGYVRILSSVIILFAGTAPALAGNCRTCDEPRIKFLDDLYALPHGVRHKDPFEERIETERHDFTQSTKTVGYHVAQIEAGYSYFYNDTGTEIERAHTTPETMLRIGLSDDIEFRVRWDYAWRFIDEAENKGGAEDLRWSFKLGVTDQDGLIPESALELRFTAPTGGSAWSTEKIEVGFDYIYEWQLCEGWDLYGSTGMATGALDDYGFVPEEPALDRFEVWHQSVALGMELTERATMYSEWYGIFTRGREQEKLTHTFNVGVDYYVTNDFVLDFRVGMGLNDDTDDLFTGIGGGYRF